ncbi:MAG: hypothetical protein V5A88_10320 [Candidatus Thermoplasmatota archaeon]
METKEDRIEKSEKKVSQKENFFEECFDRLEEDAPENWPHSRDTEDTLREEGLEIE